MLEYARLVLQGVCRLLDWSKRLLIFSDLNRVSLNPVPARSASLFLHAIFVTSDLKLSLHQCSGLSNCPVRSNMIIPFLSNACRFNSPLFRAGNPDKNLGRQSFKPSKDVIFSKRLLVADKTIPSSRACSLQHSRSDCATLLTVCWDVCWE